MCIVLPAAAKDAAGPTMEATPKTAEAIPWTQLAAKAGADYKGDGLSVVATTEAARLRCMFQRLEGEATSEGLWLTSTVSNTVNHRFRVMAVAMRWEGRASGAVSADGAKGVRCLTTLPATGEVSIEGQTVRFTRPGIVEEYSTS